VRRRDEKGKGKKPLVIIACGFARPLRETASEADGF
jgi:hypothetical protein